MNRAWACPAVIVAFLMGFISPALATWEPAPARAALRQQQPTAVLPLPFSLRQRGRTTLLTGPVRTNAGQRARVSVHIVSLKGKTRKPATAKQGRIIRKGKQLQVWLSGQTDTKVVVKLAAPARGRYAAYSHRVVYDSRDKQVGGFFSWMLDQLLNNIGGRMSDSMIGWVLSGMTVAGPEKQDQIAAQIAELSRQLSNIQSTLDQLAAALNKGFCQVQTTSAAQSTSAIKTANDTYQRLIKAGDTTLADMVDWANRYVLVSQGVETSLNTLQEVLHGAAGTTGSLGQCAQAKLDEWKRPLAEADYYQSVYDYYAYFQQYQVLGANLLTEANHIMAVNEAVKAGQPLPSDPKKTATICQAPKGSGVRGVNYFCDSADDAVTLVYWNLVRQAVDAGAAYAWNPHTDKVRVAAQKGTALVWVTDLSTYGDTRDCSKPLTSATKPCGPTVGTTGPLSDADRMGYPTWQVANAAQWTALMNAATTRKARLSQILVDAGMTGTDKLIVFTGDVSESASDPGFQWGAGWGGGDLTPLASNALGMCFLDTNIPYDTQMGVFCKGGFPLASLLNTVKFNNDSYSYSPNSVYSSNASNPFFHEGQVGGSIVGWTLHYWNAPDVRSAPGWMDFKGSGGSPQFRWPVMKAPTTTTDNSVVHCTTIPTDKGPLQVQPHNAGGALSMCGSDFVAWLKTWMPDPPQDTN